MSFLSVLTEFNIISVSFKLILAIILGGTIGLERERITRSAGFRTYALVCLGATLAMLLGYYINVSISSTYDISRIGAQVISGIGFIGAGAIINSGTNKVIGLTTAAALWTCACIGLSIGAGFYLGGVIACLLTILLLRVMKFVDRRARLKEHFVDIYLELFHANSVNTILHFFEDSNIKIVSFKSSKPKVSKNEIGVSATVVVKDNQSSWEIINQIKKLDDVSMVHKEYL